MDASLLTIAELAKRYGLPESTARFYCKRFRDYLPHVGAGKRRRYRAEAVEVFDFILAEMQSRKNASAVEASLAAKFPRYTEYSEVSEHTETTPLAPVGLDPHAMASLLRVQGKALQDIASALGRFTDRDEELTSLRQDLADKDAAISQLRLEMENLRRLQDEAERIHQQDLEQLRKWLAHLAQEQAKDSP